MNDNYHPDRAEADRLDELLKGAMIRVAPSLAGPLGVHVSLRTPRPRPKWRDLIDAAR